MNFLPVPAIDILDGNCVRLIQGDYAQVTTYRDDPVAQAVEFAHAGATRIHVVDLDGAKQAQPVNLDVVAAICSRISEEYPQVEIELGGGLRSLDTVSEAVAAGVAYCVLGTAAINDLDFLASACEQHPEKIMLGLDARNGMLAVNGWVDTTTIAAVELAQQADKFPLAGIIYTDIDQDGLLRGVNIAATVKLAAAVSCPVFASGGIATIADVDLVREANLAGTIIGKAIYTGNITLAELFAVPQLS